MTIGNLSRIGTSQVEVDPLNVQQSMRTLKVLDYSTLQLLHKTVLNIIPPRGDRQNSKKSSAAYSFLPSTEGSEKK